MTTPLEAWALAALQSLPVFHEDVGSPDKPAQLQLYASTITQAVKELKTPPLGRRNLIAASIAIMWHESRGSLRIHRNECFVQKGECDYGKAISGFQMQASGLSAPEVWPTLGFMTFDSTLLAAKESTRIFVRMYRYCEATGLPDDRVAMAFVGYAGRGCKLDGKWQGWRTRVETYQRLLRVPMPREAQKPAG